METLPAELVYDILWRLGPLPHVALVCRQWRDILADERALQKYSRLSPTEYMAVLAEWGAQDVIAWAHDRGCAWDASTCLAAARSARFDLVRWLCENDCPYDDTVAEEAAKHGHIETLEWLTQRGLNMCNVNVCATAASAGRLDTLQWLYRRGFSWDDWTCALAGANGHHDVYVWACAHGCPDRPERLWTHVIAQGLTHVVDWLRAQNRAWPADACMLAARYGRVGILERAMDDGCVCDASTCAEAAESGHRAVVKWLRSRGVPWDERTCEGFALQGDVDGLAWAHQQGCPWNVITSSRAAYGGHVDVLCYLKAHGCPWSVLTCTTAAKCGHWHAVQWLAANGCPWNESVTYAAAASGNLDMLAWAIDAGCPWTRHSVLYTAGYHGHDHIIAWVEAHFF
ncbi:Ankyrin repeat domain containing protein [Pandoravirus salinus]|uniref:Ankyrin repeat domain containing protein n=1 Tax=Pandoravirus salinus TaxID=1349410 RepID=S4VVQ4_9VIRU|nr:ankyrin repeat domain [Pandoravirus salinus]AGO84729.1 Ankyrin repeat domain containing protein [Pandoravirus salinus]